MAKVTGIGGVFIKAHGDARALAEWYRHHLGLELEDFGGAILNWREDQAEDGGLTVWGTADADGTWFDPSTAGFMINYRVDDMNGMIAQLADAGIPILKGPDTHENGRFAWIMDPEGNKVELWEPKLWDEASKG
ncbi:VOC family protein [Roseobacteraceae bacterium NS-SX3]